MKGPFKCAITGVLQEGESTGEVRIPVTQELELSVRARTIQGGGAEPARISVEGGKKIAAALKGLAPKA